MEDRATATKNSVKFGRAIFELRERTNRQTDRQIDTQKNRRTDRHTGRNSWQPYGDEVTMIRGCYVRCVADGAVSTAEQRY